MTYLLSAPSAALPAVDPRTDRSRYLVERAEFKGLRFNVPVGILRQGRGQRCRVFMESGKFINTAAP